MFRVRALPGRLTTALAALAVLVGAGVAATAGAGTAGAAGVGTADVGTERGGQ